MYLHSTRGRLTPRNSDLSFPFPQSVLELIAFARRCITPHAVYCRARVLCARRCIRFPFVLCLLRVPVCPRLFGSPRALLLRSLPHLSCISICFPFLSTALALRAPARPFPLSPCAPQRPDCLRSHGLHQRRAPVCTRMHSIPHSVSVA